MIELLAEDPLVTCQAGEWVAGGGLLAQRLLRGLRRVTTLGRGLLGDRSDLLRGGSDLRRDRGGGRGLQRRRVDRGGCLRRRGLGRGLLDLRGLDDAGRLTGRALGLLPGRGLSLLGLRGRLGGDGVLGGGRLGHGGGRGLLVRVLRGLDGDGRGQGQTGESCHGGNGAGLARK